jgi:hypothetical protein
VINLLADRHRQSGQRRLLAAMADLSLEHGHELAKEDADKALAWYLPAASWAFEYLFERAENATSPASTPTRAP